MRQIDPRAEAPCRTQLGAPGCICPPCLVIANQVAPVLFAWADARDEYIGEYRDQAHEWLASEAEEDGREIGEDELAAWYWDDLRMFDAYVALVIGGDPAELWDREAETRAVWLRGHPAAKDAAPCRMPYAPTLRCSCPEHRGPQDNSLATVAGSLWVRRETLRQLRELNSAAMFDHHDVRDLRGIETWLTVALDLAPGELPALTELTDSGLTLEQAGRALALSKGQ